VTIKEVNEKNEVKKMQNKNK